MKLVCTLNPDLQSWTKTVARIGNYITNDIPPSPLLIFKVIVKSITFNFKIDIKACVDLEGRLMLLYHCDGV